MVHVSNILILVAEEGSVELAKKGWKVFRQNRKKQRFDAFMVDGVWKIQCGSCQGGTHLCLLSKFRIKIKSDEANEVEVYGVCSSMNNKMFLLG